MENQNPFLSQSKIPDSITHSMCFHLDKSREYRLSHFFGILFPLGLAFGANMKH